MPYPDEQPFQMYAKTSVQLAYTYEKSKISTDPSVAYTYTRDTGHDEVWCPAPFSAVFMVPVIDQYPSRLGEP